MHDVLTGIFIHITRLADPAATDTKGLVLCLLVRTGTNRAIIGADDDCRSRDRSHAYGHHGSLGTTDGCSHRRDGVWRITHVPPRRRNRAHPAGRHGYRVRPEFPSAHHQTYTINTCQEDMALEILTVSISDELKFLEKPKYTSNLTDDKGGSLYEVKGDSLYEVKGSSLYEVKGSSLYEVKGDSLYEV